MAPRPPRSRCLRCAIAVAVVSLATGCGRGPAAPSAASPAGGTPAASPLPTAPAPAPAPADASRSASTPGGAATRYAAGGQEVEAGLYPDKPAFVLGEPVYLAFRVKNLSTTAVYSDHLGGSADVFGRRERFSVRAVDAAGAALPGPVDGDGMRAGNAVDGPEKISPGGVWETRLLLADAATIRAPGRYHLRCRYDLGLGRTMDAAWPDKANHVAVDVETDITILPPDADALGMVISAYARQAATSAGDAGDTPSLRR